MANGFLTGVAEGLGGELGRRRKQRFALALESQKLEGELKKIEARKLTPETTGALGQLFAPEGQVSLFEQGQRVSPEEGRILLGTRQPVTGLDRKITNPNDPFLRDAAEGLGISPEELANRGVTIRELSLAERRTRQKGISQRFATGVDVGIRKAIRQVESRFAATEAIINDFGGAIQQLSTTGRAAAIGKGLNIKIEQLAQQATSDSLEDQQIRRAVAIFGRSRPTAVLKITQGISGVQMREDEKADISAGLPVGTDTLAYAATYMSVFKGLILSGKDAEILALVTPTSENRSVLSARSRENRSEIDLLKNKLRTFNAERGVAGPPGKSVKEMSAEELLKELTR